MSLFGGMIVFGSCRFSPVGGGGGMLSSPACLPSGFMPSSRSMPSMVFLPPSSVSMPAVVFIVPAWFIPIGCMPMGSVPIMPVCIGFIIGLGARPSSPVNFTGSPSIKAGSLAPSRGAPSPLPAASSPPSTEPSTSPSLLWSSVPSASKFSRGCSCGPLTGCVPCSAAASLMDENSVGDTPTTPENLCETSCAGNCPIFWISPPDGSSFAVSNCVASVISWPERSRTTIAPSTTVISPVSTFPAMMVPRMPIEPLGVSIFTSSGSSRPMRPEVKTNIPLRTEKSCDPDSVEGS